jgi:hypothetical protein
VMTARVVVNGRVLPVQVAQMIDGQGGDDPLLSKVWWDDVLPWPQQPKLRHHGRV